MSAWIGRTIDLLNYYDGRDAAITLTLYIACLLSGFYPVKSNLHRSFQRIAKRLTDCRVVLRLYDDLGVIRNLFTYDLRPGEQNWLVRLLKFVHYLSWLGYFPSEHVSWLGQVKLLDIDVKLWNFFASAFWSIALFTSALWHTCIILQYMAQRHYSNEKKESEKKSFIPWTAVRDATFATVRDGTEFIVAVNCLPRGLLWSSTLTHTQVGMLGTCAGVLRVFALFRYGHRT